MRWFPLRSKSSKGDGVFTPEPEAPKDWTPEERTALRCGQTVYRHSTGRRSDDGMAAVVVKTTAETLAEHILDVDAYVEFLPYVTGSRVLRTEEFSDHRRVDAELELTTKGIVTRYEIETRWYPEASWLPFQMVAHTGGALRGGSGSWHLYRWDEDWSRTLLVYDIRLESARWVPGFARRLAANRGLPAAAELIAKRAECNS